MPPRSHRTFTVILEKEADGGYSVHCPALPGCVSQGEDRRAALANIKEAIGLVLTLPEKKGSTPRPETPALLSKELRHILRGREQDGLPLAGVSLEPVKISVKVARAG